MNYCVNSPGLTMLFVNSQDLTILFINPQPLSWLPETPHWLAEHRKHALLADYVHCSERFNAQRLDLRTCRRSARRHEAFEEGRGRAGGLRAMLRALLDRRFGPQMLVNGYIQ